MKTQNSVLPLFVPHPTPPPTRPCIHHRQPPACSGRILMGIPWLAFPALCWVATLPSHNEIPCPWGHNIKPKDNNVPTMVEQMWLNKVSHVYWWSSLSPGLCGSLGDHGGLLLRHLRARILPQVGHQSFSLVHGPHSKGSVDGWGCLGPAKSRWEVVESVWPKG